jgi:hypothetical protein
VTSNEKGKMRLEMERSARTMGGLVETRSGGVVVGGVQVVKSRRKRHLRIDLGREGIGLDWIGLDWIGLDWIK